MQKIISIITVFTVFCLSEAKPFEKRGDQQEFTLEDAKKVTHCLEGEHFPTAVIAGFVHEFIKGLEDQGSLGKDGELIKEFVDFAIKAGNKNLIDHVLDTMYADFGTTHFGALYTAGKNRVDEVTKGLPSHGAALACFELGKTERNTDSSEKSNEFDEERILRLLKNLLD